ncbi:myb/SANT-like DNA-binding domain-containing protein 2 isoform 6-T6 [Alca torda]
MAASCGSSQLPPAEPPLKIPKMEVLSPGSPGALSDGNPSLSDPSTPSGASPLGPGPAAGGAGPGVGGGAGGRGGASPSVSFSPGGAAAAAAAAACRGMSWTPAETNALIAVWGNERLVEARYQQLEGAGTVFGSKAPGPAMYERVSRALAELGYERTPSQCRERIKEARRHAEHYANPGVGPAEVGAVSELDGLLPAPSFQQTGHFRHRLQHPLEGGHPLPLRRDQLPGTPRQTAPGIFQLGKTGGPGHHDPGAENELEKRLLQIPGDHHQRSPLPGAPHGDRLDPHRPLQTHRRQRRAVFIAGRDPQKPRFVRHRLRGMPRETPLPSGRAPGARSRQRDSWGAGGPFPASLPPAGYGIRPDYLLLPRHRRGPDSPAVPVFTFSGKHQNLQQGLGGDQRLFISELPRRARRLPQIHLHQICGSGEGFSFCRLFGRVPGKSHRISLKI